MEALLSFPYLNFWKELQLWTPSAAPSEPGRWKWGCPGEQRRHNAVSFMHKSWTSCLILKILSDPWKNSATLSIGRRSSMKSGEMEACKIQPSDKFLKNKSCSNFTSTMAPSRKDNRGQKEYQHQFIIIVFAMVVLKETFKALTFDAAYLVQPAMHSLPNHWLIFLKNLSLNYSTLVLLQSL